MVTTTYRDLLEFYQTANSFLAQKENDDTKLRYALARMVKRAKRIIEKVDQQKEDALVENCAEDETGNIRRDSRGSYVYSKTGLAKLNAQVRALVDQNVEIEPYYVQVNGLDELTSLAFEGFVIKREGNDNQ
jgi:hypothetical protein